MRQRRQTWELPGDWVPFKPSQNPLSILPTNPFSQGFGTGFSLNSGERYHLGGSLSFPVYDRPNKLIWPFDLNGNLITGLEDFNFGFGETSNPANPFDIPVDRLYPYLVSLPLNRYGSAGGGEAAGGGGAEGRMAQAVASRGGGAGAGEGGVAGRSSPISIGEGAQPGAGEGGAAGRLAQSSVGTGGGVQPEGGGGGGVQPEGGGGAEGGSAQSAAGATGGSGPERTQALFRQFRQFYYL